MFEKIIQTLLRDVRMNIFPRIINPSKECFRALVSGFQTKLTPAQMKKKKKNMYIVKV